MFLEYVVKDDKYLRVTVDTRTPVKIGDFVSVCLDFEEQSLNIVPTQMQLNIVFEDDAILILDKPAGIAVPPSASH